MLENDTTGAQTEKHQVRMMGEINKLTEGSIGVLDPADYERTVQTLLSGGSDPVITKAPGGRLDPRRHRRRQALSGPVGRPDRPPALTAGPPSRTVRLRRAGEEAR